MNLNPEDVAGLPEVFHVELSSEVLFELRELSQTTGSNQEMRPRTAQ